MDMEKWFLDLREEKNKKALPILSFPSVQLLGITVNRLITDSDLQAKGMKAVADRCDSLAAVSMMDLSVEAEAFGSSIKTDDHEVPTVTGSIVNSLADARELKIPAVGDGRTGLYLESLAKARELINDRPVFAGVIGPFSLAARLVDMTEIMVNCYVEPEMVHLTLRKTTDFLKAYCKAYKGTGAGGILMAEPAAGLLSPELIAEFSTPYVKEIVDAVKTRDFALVYHNCGNTIPLIDSILKTGASAYHFGNAVSLSQMLSLLPGDVTAMGNVDPAGQFRGGTPESIYEDTMRVLRECGDYPNFVISSGCDIPPLAPWENIDSFFRAVKEFYS